LESEEIREKWVILERDEAAHEGGWGEQNRKRESELKEMRRQVKELGEGMGYLEQIVSEVHSTLHDKIEC
jgi:hypothetical protein